MTRTITITSGKGGVGKTNLSLNLALELARLGHPTCLFDADFGTANVNILLGISPRYDIKDAIMEGIRLEDILVPETNNLDILPGSSGVEAMANLKPEQMEGLLGSLATMKAYDFLVIDTAAGISKNVVSFCLASSEVVLIITHEPTSLTDAYALLKVLGANGYKGTARVVVNRCQDSSHARITFATFKNAVSKHLNLKVAALGLVLEDSKMVEAIRLQEPFLHKFPDSQVAKCFHLIASRLIENKDGIAGADLESFWRSTLEAMSSTLHIPNSPRRAVKEIEGMALSNNNESSADAVVTELRLLRHTLEDIADKLGQTRPTETTKLGAQMAGPVLKLDLDELLAGSKKSD
ncbi:MAG: MinD/ParA family protein [Proteobacteria bacterium]|nr:MinD/ParA family protein [Pseudomonadota bacterium]MBU1640874.1 MinD/ParA family protein [Pseudomonadota bacterium]